MSRHIVQFVSVCATILALSCWLPSISFAQSSALSANPAIQQGQLHYNAQNYSKSIASFQAALKSPATIFKDRITALRYLGFISVILGKGKDAKDYFERLLKLDPSYKLDDLVPPKFVRVFDAVKKEFIAKRKVGIEVMTPTEVPTDKPVELRIKVRDHLKQAKQIIVWYRVENTGQFSKNVAQEVTNPDWKNATSRSPWIDIRIARRRACQGKPAAKTSTASDGYRYFTYSIPKFSGRAQAYFVEYFVAAYDGKNAVLATYGSNKVPKRVKRTIPAKKIVPVKKGISPWVWVGVAGGVVAVAAAITIPLVLANQGPPAPPDTGGALVTVITKTQ